MKSRCLLLFVLVLCRSAYSLEKETPEEWKWEDSGEYLRILGSFSYYAMNYATDASSEVQELALGDKDHYEFRLHFGYLNQFADQAVFFGLGGDYHIWKPLKLSVDTRFAPAQTVPSRQDYAAGLAYRFLEKWLDVGARYRFQDYRQANLQEAGPIVRVGLLERFWLTGSYLFGESRLGNGRQPTRHRFETRLDARISLLGLAGFYGRSEHDFESGAPDNPFKSFTAHDFGGRIQLSFLMGSGLFFEFRGQDRDNGQNQQIYTIGTFFEM